MKTNTNTNSALVSIVTSVYNLENYISETITSVLNQSYSNWEMILIDDCSTDNSVKIIKEFATKDPRIKLIRNDVNSGAAITRNKGIKMAKGNYLAFLDGDDIWYPEFLLTSLKKCQEENCNFVFSSYNRVDENLQPLIEDFIVPDKVEYKNVLKSCPILCSSTVINIEKLGKNYMPLLNKRQDWGFFLKILKEEKYAYGIKKPLVKYRIRKDSISRKKLKLIPYVWKVYTEVEGINYFRSFYLLCNWSFFGFVKYYIKK